MPPREPASSPSDGRTESGAPPGAAAPTGAVAPADPESTPGPVVSPTQSTEGPAILDFRRTARRLAVAVSIIGIAVAVSWVALVVTTGASLRLLAELAGLGLLAAFVVEVVVVGGSAVRGMLAAGERGERLADSDVALVPPQLLRRKRR